MSKTKKENKFEEEVEKLKIDIAGSFFMDLIGQNMSIFVELLKKIIVPGSPELANELEKLHVEPVTLEKKFDNAMVPRGRPKRDEDLDEVHWLFIVKNPDIKKQIKKLSDLKNDDFIVYNAYEKKMQLNGSHQFCQSYALYMAYNYYSGIPISVTNPRDAYLDLLTFWKLLIDNINLTEPKLNTKTNIKSILEPIIELNKNTEPDKDVVEHVILHFPSTLLKIYKIMTSEYAKIYCPTWF